MNAEHPSASGDGLEAGTSSGAGHEDNSKGARSGLAGWWRAATRQPARAAIFVLGLAAVIAAFVVWLIPTSSGTTTTSEHSTTAVTNSAGRKATTAVDKTTVTRAPGANRSDTVLVALLTFGGGLLLATSFWDRIGSLGFGGVSISLADTAVAPPRIEFVDAAALHVETSTSTSVDVALVPQVESIARRELRLVCVKFREGDRDLWAPLNLSLFVLLVARRTKAEVIIFFEAREAAPDPELAATGPRTYLGAASVARLADRLAADDPVLAAAYRATERIPLARSDLAAGEKSIGRSFFDKLNELDPSRKEGAQAPEERVDLSRLQELAGRVLITDSVPAEGERTLSPRLQRDILAFPLPYVPITDRRKLEELVDRSRLAEQIALSAVRATSRA